MTRQPIIHLGVIGPGPDWESRYGPAVAKLGNRCRISVVYDDTAARAEDVARTVDAKVAHGVRRFFSERPLTAVLLLHLGWQRSWLLETAFRAGVPLFLGQHVLRHSIVRERLETLNSLAEDILVPEQPIRYYASMLRLRELMATQLGPAHKVHLDLRAAQSVLGEEVNLSDLLSWCGAAFGLRSETASRLPPGPTETRSGIRRLAISAPHGRLVELEVRSTDADSSSAETSTAEPMPFCRVGCRNGQVDLIGPRALHWDTGAGIITEDLKGDRSAIDVMLDLFARRAAGGLIPVADLGEISRGERLASLLRDDG